MLFFKVLASKLESQKTGRSSVFITSSSNDTTENVKIISTARCKRKHRMQSKFLLCSQETKSPGLRPMEPRDVPSVLRLFNKVRLILSLSD